MFYLNVGCDAVVARRRKVAVSCFMSGWLSLEQMIVIFSVAVDNDASFQRAVVPNECWLGQDYGKRGVLPWFPWLLVFRCRRVVTCGLKTWVFWHKDDKRRWWFLNRQLLLFLGCWFNLRGPCGRRPLLPTLLVRIVAKLVRASDGKSGLANVWCNGSRQILYAWLANDEKVEN